MPANAKSKLTMIAVLGAILGAAIIAGLPYISRQLGNAALSEVANSGRSAKLIMDTFAMDNDGVYPSEDSASFYDCPLPTSSNDLLKQLFASGNTNSERIFWVKGATVCNDTSPDDVSTSGGMFDPAQTLLAGDNGWSYFTDLTNVDRPDLPILVAAFTPGSSDLDPVPFKGRAVIIHINNTASVINTDGTTPSGSLPDLERGDPSKSQLKHNTTAILNQLRPDGSPLTILHPLSATP